MPDEIGRLPDVRATCAWLGCSHAATVRVEYVRGEGPTLRLAWLRADRGRVTLCDVHTWEFGRELGRGGRVSLTRLG